MSVRINPDGLVDFVSCDLCGSVRTFREGGCEHTRDDVRMAASKDRGEHRCPECDERLVVSSVPGPTATALLEDEDWWARRGRQICPDCLLGVAVLGRPTIAYRPVPVGEFIDEWMHGNDCDRDDMARRLGVTRDHIDELLSGGAALTPEAAAGLEQVTGVPAYHWWRLEATCWADSAAAPPSSGKPSATGPRRRPRPARTRPLARGRAR